MTSRIVLGLGKMLETILDMIRIIIWKIIFFFQLGVFHMINPGKAGLFCRYRHSSPNNFFSVRDMSNNVYIERKLRFWRLRISARQSGIRSGKVESDEIPIQVKNVIFRFSQENIVIFALRSN